MTVRSDQMLVAAIRASDASAFEEFYGRHFGVLFRLAVKKIGDEDDAYDLLQDMFAELWEIRENLVITNAPEAWLRNRLWFKLSGYFRTKGFREKHIRKFAEFLQMEEEGPVDEMEANEINLQYEAMMALIDRTIEEMPSKMKTVFLMSRDGERNINEIARTLELSPKTVKNQINSALNRIRRAVSHASVPTVELLLLIWLTKN